MCIVCDLVEFLREKQPERSDNPGNAEADPNFLGIVLGMAMAVTHDSVSRRGSPEEARSVMNAFNMAFVKVKGGKHPNQVVEEYRETLAKFLAEQAGSKEQNAPTSETVQ